MIWRAHPRPPALLVTGRPFARRPDPPWRETPEDALQPAEASPPRALRGPCSLLPPLPRRPRPPRRRLRRPPRRRPRRLPRRRRRQMTPHPPPPQLQIPAQSPPHPTPPPPRRETWTPPRTHSRPCSGPRARPGGRPRVSPGGRPQGSPGVRPRAPAAHQPGHWSTLKASPLRAAVCAAEARRLPRGPALAAEAAAGSRRGRLRGA
mmetsp:Transcript_20050/g.63399  ORF Transcript_20050/g.63399 Transcript_20050/m.63399 type:complete len:206 (+) Transcript_20050:1328-1945(+)